MTTPATCCEACGRPLGDRGQRLNAAAIKRLQDEAEANEACGDPRTAAALRMVLEWHGEAKR